MKAFQGVVLLLALSRAAPWLARSLHRATWTSGGAATNEPSHGARCSFPVTSCRRSGRHTRRTTTCASLSSSSADLDGDTYDVNVLLIDYYDSFTYNLVHMLSRLCRNPPTVLAADCSESWDDLKANNLTAALDGILLSPGPGNPTSVAPLAQSIVQQNPDLPILGVCLGHQIMGCTYGATVQLAPEPIHGQVRPIRVTNLTDPLWQNTTTNGTLDVTRYHSLCVTNLPPSLQCTAVTDDADELVMAMSHTEYPHYGVQFHPESIGTQYGYGLIQNFLKVVADHKREEANKTLQSEAKDPATHKVVWRNPTEPSCAGRQKGVSTRHHCAHGLTKHDTESRSSRCTKRREVYVQKVENSQAEPEQIMMQVFGGSKYSFWLDSSDPRSDPSFSFLGSSEDRIEYWGKEKPLSSRGIRLWRENILVESFPDQDILNYLDCSHREEKTDSVVMVRHDDKRVKLTRMREEEANLPFAFRGGHVGYLGYEVRHDTARFLEEAEHGLPRVQVRAPPDNSPVPTAAFLVVSRSLAFDHSSKTWYLIATVSSKEQQQDTLEWMSHISGVLSNRVAPTSRVVASWLERNPHSIAPVNMSFRPHRVRSKYHENFAECMEHIRQGNSYELCLTNKLEADVDATLKPINLYKRLRRKNPAPYSAYLQWGDAFSICCSSPERFLTIIRDDSRELIVETKPIKGTRARALPFLERQREDRARAYELQNSAKDRAENLMIVDLMRNDLSRVCDNVHVPMLMGIESFATVHQMVSTIRGTLQNDKTALDVLKSCFPGGSMTGAPKRQTMEILDCLEEGRSRGPYSGSLGFLSWNGCVDLNIVIRTVVVESSRVTVGAGGAITALSDSSDEYDELMLKASAVVAAIKEWASSEEVDIAVAHNSTKFW